LAEVDWLVKGLDNDILIIVVLVSPDSDYTVTAEFKVKLIHNDIFAVKVSFPTSVWALPFKHSLNKG